jgi:hypothetical protein
VGRGRRVRGLRYHFVPVAIKHQHAAAVLRRHKDLSFSTVQCAIDLLLSRRHNEGARRLLQLVQHRALGLLDGAFVRVLAYDLKQLHGLIWAGLHHASALKRHNAPTAQREPRTLRRHTYTCIYVYMHMHMRMSAPALPVPPASAAVVDPQKILAAAALLQHDGAQSLRHAYSFRVVSLHARDVGRACCCARDLLRAAQLGRTWSEFGQK